MTQTHSRRKSTGKLLRAALRYLRKQETRVVRRARTGHMTPDRLRHTMEGENRRGYHYRPGGEDFPHRRTGPVLARDPHTGVYRAEVEFEVPPGSGNWAPKAGNGGVSTFFPDHWTPQQVDRSVRDAFQNGTRHPDGSWTGTAGGIQIRGYYDQVTGALRHGFPRM